MKKDIYLLFVIAIVISMFGIEFVHAQQPGIGRAELQRADLTIKGIEVIQVRVEIGPGLSFPRHSHPGEEVIYVLEGLLEYRIDGRPPVTLQAGEVYFIPTGMVHSVRNTGQVKAFELATYIVVKDKPLVNLVK